MSTERRLLLTGATGYVGGRLLPLLEQRRLPVRCLTRRTAALEGRAAESTEVVQGDLLEPQSLDAACAGIDTAYYFVHSMGTKCDFVRQDRSAAKNFARAAANAEIRKIIYLGGLGNSEEDLSRHLRSRQEIGDILRSSGAQVIEFRASIIIGSGSLSFELIRALVERLPMMICPRWVSVKAQPIAIEDVLAYLIEALEHHDDCSHVVEIGGPDQVSYGQIMREYARQRGLRRLMVPVPVLTPRLSSLWLGLVTPVYARVGRKLVDSLRNPTLVADPRADTMFQVRPRGLRAAVERALTNEDQEIAATRWSDALSSAGPARTWGGVRFGSRIIDSKTATINEPAHRAFAPVRRIGGSTGWYYGNWLWQIRGFFDLLVGGVGVRRGRRDPENLRIGDAVDFWRVEAIEPDRVLRLKAEMKVPGRAWLEFEVTEHGTSSTIRQTAIFDPVGLFGLVYWYALLPLHQFIFAGMLRNIARAADKQAGCAPPASSENRDGPVRPIDSNQPATLPAGPD